LYLECGHVEQQKVTARELDDILAGERSQPVVVDFYATWCGPCILLAQELEMLAVEYGDRVRFLKVDTDEEHELATQMEIRGLPTMVFVSKDTEKLAIRTEGLLPGDVIRNIIEKEL
jgi:thioredoxin